MSFLTIFVPFLDLLNPHDTLICCELYSYSQSRVHRLQVYYAEPFNKKPSFFLFFPVKFCGIPLPPVHMQIEGSSGSYTESYAPLSKGVAKDTSYFVF